jgi:hypothetical protein
MALTLGFLLNANTAEATEKLEAFALKTEAITAGLEGHFANAQAGITRSLLSLVPSFGLVTGAVAGIGIALFEMANKASEAGAKLAVASRATGVSTTVLQGLQLAGKEAGLGLDQIQRAMVHLATATSDLESPMSSSAKALAQLGITGKDLADFKLKSMDDKLYEVIDRLGQVKDGGERAAIGAALLGARTEKLVGVLGEGSDALKDISKKAEEFSGITKDVADKDLEFQQQLTETKAKLSGVAQQLEQATVPAFTALLKAITATVLKMEEFKATVEGNETAIKKIIEAEDNLGETAGAAEKFQAGLEHATQDGTKAIEDQEAAVKDAQRAMALAIATQGFGSKAANDATAAYEKEKNTLSELTTGVDEAAKKLKELQKQQLAEANALAKTTKETMEADLAAHGYYQQLELMKKAVEEVSKAEDEHAAKLHASLQEYLLSQGLRKRTQEEELKAQQEKDKGLDPLKPLSLDPYDANKSLEELGKEAMAPVEPFQKLQAQIKAVNQALADMHNIEKGLPTKPLDAVTLAAHTAADAIGDIADKVGEMSDKFGKAGPAMQKASEMLKKMADAQKQGKSVAEAFGAAQKGMGATAAESATLMAASFGEEAASFIKNKRAQAIVMAVMETAKGLADLAIEDYEGAALAFASSAMYGVVAGMSGGGGSGGKSAANIGGGSGSGGGGGGQGTVGGGSMLGGGGSGSGNYHQTVVNVYGGGLTDTNNLQNLVTSLNQGGGAGTVRLNVAGTSATIPTPAY